MTFHFIILCVQSTFVQALYTMYVHEGITLTKRQCKTDKNYRHKNSLLLICTEPIVHYVAITLKM